MRTPMSRPPRVALLAALAAAGSSLLAPSGALALRASAAVAGVDYRAGEVVVSKADQSDPQVVKVHGSVDRAVKRLARKPGVVSVNRNWIARASFIPNDPGRPGGAPGDWQTLQWNFLPGIAGVNAPA